MGREVQLTSGPGGRVLTNTGVWSTDGYWVVYDTRPDPAGDVFAGTRIEVVNVETGEVRCLYDSRNGAFCGVATWCPTEPAVAFILGPEHPKAEWSYGPSRRQGVLVRSDQPGVAVPLDARDLTEPYTPGALRGGSHVHVFSPCGGRLSFTYEDEALQVGPPGAEPNRRTVAVGVPRPVRVGRGHPRNHDGCYFCVVAARTTADPRPGTDDVAKAFEEGWVGVTGYLKPGNRRQRWAVAFQGHVVTPAGETISEVFVADLPDDLTVAGDNALEGTDIHYPAPPRGTSQRRLTFTRERKYPGLQGPRHWLRSSPDGAMIAFLMRGDDGIPQLWTVSTNGGPPVQRSRLSEGVGSAFTWTPDGRAVVLVTGNRVARVSIECGDVVLLTQPRGRQEMIRPESCVVSPDGRRAAFVVQHGPPANSTNQIHVVSVTGP